MQSVIEKNVEDLLSVSVNDLGYDIVRVKFFDGSARTLQIMIERIDGAVLTVEDCEKVSHHVSSILDIEDLIKTEYSLEVSSPGLDRPLVKLKDFEKYIGSEVKIKTREPINNCKNFSGYVMSVKDNIIELKSLDKQDYKIINYDLIDNASLVISNDLFSKAKH